MKQSRFGLILLLSSGGLLACNGDPTSSQRESGESKIVAVPNVIYLDKGASTFLTLQLVDATGNQLATTFDAVSEDPLVTVTRDTTFLATTNGANLNTNERFSIAGSDYVLTGIKVTAGSDTLTVPVSVVPKTTIAATFSNLSPALAETVTLTAPAGISFSETSTVSFGANALAPANVVVAADGSSISFLPPPNLTAAPATITDVKTVGSPDLTFTNATTDGLTTPEVVDLPGTVSSFTPAANQVVTVTLNGATSATPTDPAVAAVSIGALPAVVVSRTPTTIGFVPPPLAVGPVVVGGVFLDVVPQFELTLTTPDTLTVGPVVPLGGTGSPGTAPTLAVPTPVLYDAGTFTYQAPILGGQFGNFPARLYKFTIPTTGDYDITLDWASGEDMGAYFFQTNGTTETGTPADGGGGGVHPETSTSTFTAGTYLVAIVNFSATDPSSFSIVFAPTPPE